MRTAIALLALSLSAGTLSAAEEHSFWWYAKAKVACLPDAARLCSGAMPDEALVRKCMEDKKKLVSASCQEFYPGGKNAD